MTMKARLCIVERFKLVMGPGSNYYDLGQVGSIFCGSGRVSHLWFGFEFGKFPLKMTNFSIFFPSDKKKSLQAGSESTWVEGGSASYLLWVKSKLGSGQGPSLNFKHSKISSWINPLQIFLLILMFIRLNLKVIHLFAIGFALINHFYDMTISVRIGRCAETWWELSLILI